MYIWLENKKEKKKKDETDSNNDDDDRNKIEKETNDTLQSILIKKNKYCMKFRKTQNNLLFMSVSSSREWKRKSNTTDKAELKFKKQTSICSKNIIFFKKLQLISKNII